jgi:hypothetical protein
VSPRGALPIEPVTRRAISETIADARHEWQRAESMSAKCLAIMRFAVALTRAIAMASVRECALALRSPFAWRWLAIGVGMTVALLAVSAASAGLPPGRQWIPRAEWFLVTFFVTTPLSVYIAALTGRRDIRVPVVGLTMFVGAVLAFALLLVLPTIQSQFYTTFTARAREVASLSAIAYGLGGSYLVFCFCALQVAECARDHHRRDFISVLGFVLPVCARTLFMQFAPPFLRHVGLWGIVALPLTAALPLALMWFVVTRFSREEVSA